jgi:hypothetical protein
VIPEQDVIATFLARLQPSPRVRVLTMSSVWIVSTASYVRLPRFEAPDPDRRVLSLWGRCDDAVSHRLLAAWWARSRKGDLVLRLLPAAGPGPDGFGVVSSPVVSVSGCAAFELLPPGERPGVAE